MFTWIVTVAAAAVVRRCVYVVSVAVEAVVRWCMCVAMLDASHERSPCAPLYAVIFYVVL